MAQVGTKTGATSKSERTGATVGLVIGQLTAGGAEGQLFQLARGLRGSGYRPIVYCASDRTEPIGSQLRAANIPLRTISGSRSLRPFRLARALSEDRIDLVHAWLYIGNTYAWLGRLRCRNLPLITSARNCKWQGLLHGLANALAFRSSRCIIVNSQEVARYVARVYRAPSERLRVIYNGVDVERFSPSPEAAGDDPLVVGMGRLVAQKDPFFFLEGAARLAALHARVRFAFVGAGPLSDKLRAEVKSRGMEGRFDVPGETRDAAAVMQRATLFWLSSAWEGLPNVVLEAMACGVPVIAGDVGGAREIVRPGVDGFLIAHGDAEALVHYSYRLLSDPDARQKTAARARARSLSFSVSQMVRSIVRLYDEVAPPLTRNGARVPSAVAG